MNTPSRLLQRRPGLIALALASLLFLLFLSATFQPSVAPSFRSFKSGQTVAEASLENINNSTFGVSKPLSHWRLRTE